MSAAIFAVLSMIFAGVALHAGMPYWAAALAFSGGWFGGGAVRNVLDRLYGTRGAP